MSHIRLIKSTVMLGLLGSSITATAGYQFHNPGPMLNLGKTSHPGSILSIGNNPAAGEVLIPEDEDVRTGYFSTLGVQAEFGEADNFIDEVDQLKDDLETDFDNIGDAEDALNRLNEVLPVLGEDAHTTVQTSLYVPLMPVAVRSDTLGGVLSFSLHASGIADISFLDDEVTINPTGSGFTLETDSAIYAKSARLLTGSLGYSREVWQPEFVADSKLYAGIEANIYRASLNKQVISVQGIIDDNEDDVRDAIRDEIDENTVHTTEVGVDLGFLMTMPNAQVGITFANINEPEFDYGAIGTDCLAITDPIRQTNCFIAQNVFSDEIDLTETAVMNAQTTVEGALYTRNKQWLLAGSADLNSTYDFVGRERQYINASASYQSGSYTVPSPRISISKNLKGYELTTIGLGATWFGIFNFDIFASLDTIEVDGTTVPRHVGFNFGFEEKF